MTLLADTNVIVRLIVNDDAEQVRRALSLLKKEGFEISLTVLLERPFGKSGIAPQQPSP